jgi:hypothetical protein
LDKITDYVSKPPNSSVDRKKHHNSPAKTVFNEMKDTVFLKRIIKFLIEKFRKSNHLTMIDFLFKNYYNTLAKSLQSASFKFENYNYLQQQFIR